MSKPEINLWEVLYRKRLGLGPFYVGVGAAALAGLSSLLGDVETIIAVVAVALALGAWAHTRVKDGLRRGYAFTVIGSSALWIIVAHLYSTSLLSALIVANLSATLVLGIGWWTSHRQRAQVRMAEALKDWPELVKRINYDKIPAPGVTISPIGYGGKLKWAPGEYDVADIIRDKGKFENMLGADHGQMRMERDGKSTNSVKFQVITNDPHSLAQDWAPPTSVVQATDPLAIGPREDGIVATIRRFERNSGVRHALIAGATESGKSSLVNLMVATDVCSDEVFQIGFDFKQVELTPWERAMGFVITKVPSAVEMVRGFAAPGGLLETRGDILAERGRREGKGVRIWDTKKDGPIISIVVDEAKDLLGTTDSKTVDAFALIATKGRALGVRFVIATQFPTLEAIGSSQIRQQVRHRFCFRMQDSAGESFVMPGHRVRAEAIDAERKGTCYMLDGDRLESMPIRVYWIDDDMVAAVVAARAGRTPELDARSAEAIELYFPDFANRMVRIPEPTGTSTGTDGGTGTGTSPGTDDGGTGTSPGTTGTDVGTVPAGDEEGDAMAGTGDEWVDLNKGPQVEIEDVMASRDSHLTEEERERLERDRRVALAEVPGQRLNEEQARDALIRALEAAGPEGAKAKDLQVAADRSSSWFYKVAAQMAEDGIVKRTTRGKWMILKPKLSLVTTAPKG
jgi:hypothetical protein